MLLVEYFLLPWILSGEFWGGIQLNIEDHFDDIIISATPVPELAQEIQELKESEIQEQEEVDYLKEIYEILSVPAETEEVIVSNSSSVLGTYLNDMSLDQFSLLFMSVLFLVVIIVKGGFSHE